MAYRMAAENLWQWVATQKRTYIGNATSVRDYRVQLRGSRSALLFSLYLLVLIGVAMVVYSQSQGTSQGISEVQRHLHDFYQVIMLLLGIVVSLVAPALAATAVVTERQRRSLDLIFSAPVTPKYYLVGKALAAFRYTWMLLVLALPITAACVVMGGATWSDVLISFILLSFQGLVLVSIGLLMSALASKAVSAVVWTYGAVAFYLLIASGLSAIASGSEQSLQGVAQYPFTIDLSPFYVLQGAPSISMWAGLAVPNWILACLACLGISKLFLLGAGCVLDPSNSQLVKRLRIHGLIYAGAIAAAMGGLLNPQGLQRDNVAGQVLISISLPLVFVLPHLTCFALDGARRYKPNGLFAPRRMLDGTPAGALPYLLSLIGISSVALAASSMVAGYNVLNGSYVSSTIYVAALWTLIWALGRAASTYLISAHSTTLSAARVLNLVGILVLLVLPLPIIMALDSSSGNVQYYLILSILRPLFSTPAQMSPTWAYALLSIFGAVGITWWSETQLAEKLSKKQATEKSPLTDTLSNPMLSAIPVTQADSSKESRIRLNR